MCSIPHASRRSPSAGFFADKKIIFSTFLPFLGPKKKIRRSRVSDSWFARKVWLPVRNGFHWMQQPKEIINNFDNRLSSFPRCCQTKRKSVFSCFDTKKCSCRKFPQEIDFTFLGPLERLMVRWGDLPLNFAASSIAWSPVRVRREQISSNVSAATLSLQARPVIDTMS